MSYISIPVMSYVSKRACFILVVLVLAVHNHISINWFRTHYCTGKRKHREHESFERIDGHWKRPDHALISPICDLRPSSDFEI